jgi:hypothetical protein
MVTVYDIEIRFAIPHFPIGIAVVAASFVRLVLSHASSNLQPTSTVGTGLDYSTIGHRLVVETPRPSLGNVARS